MTLKQERMAEKIRTILSELLLREISDPRLHSVTVTEVRLDAEFNHASIYVNALGDEDRQQEVMTGLESAKGFLRREVGGRVRLRVTPELHFYWDTTLEYGERMNQLLNSLDIPPEEASELNTENDTEMEADE